MTEPTPQITEHLQTKSEVSVATGNLSKELDKAITEELKNKPKDIIDGKSSK
jgi:hypothetical protein